MAKAVESEPLTLAERLFAMHWRPQSGRSAEALASECIEAAAAFDRTARVNKPSPDRDSIRRREAVTQGT